MKSSSGSGRKVRMILVSITISLLLCMGAGIFLFKWWGSTLPPVVAIQRPESGHMAEVDQVLPFLVSATFDKGISRLELYADGALVGSQDTSLPGGDNPLMMAQSWMPLTTGRHVLMARAYDLQHKFYDSSVVDINVVGKLSDTATINTRDIPLGPNASLPSLSDVALASDTPLDTLRALNPGLGDLAESAPLPNDASLTVPYSPAPPPENPIPNPEPLEGTPASPQITNSAAVDCSTVQLAWNDVSEESGYTIYRLANGGSSFSAVAHLGADVTSYTDTITRYGNYQYQVAADKGLLESLSSVASVSTPDNCEPPAPAGTTNLTVNFFSLITRQRFDGIYCYSSLAGSPFKRIPQHDFQVMQPGADGLTYDLRTQLADYGQLSLPAQSTSKSFSLTLECWGRLGAESTALGTVRSARSSSEWDGRDIAEDAGSVLLHYRIDQNPVSARPINVDLTPGIPGQSLNLPRDFNRILDPTIPAPTNVRDIRPLVVLCNIFHAVGIDAAACASISWRPGDGIAWDWSDPTGRNTEQTLTGFRLMVNQLDMQDPHHPILTTLWILDLEPGTLKSSRLPAVVNDIACDTSIQIHVQAVSGWTEGEYSDPLVLYGPHCTGNNLITIKVDQIVVGDGVNPESVTDNDPCILCTDRRLELYGSMVFSPIYARIMEGPTGHFGPEFGGCPDHTECTPAFTHRYDAPDYRDRMYWNSLLINRQAPGPGETLTILVDLYDYDYFTFLTSFGPGAVLPHAGISQPWCQDRLVLPGRSAVEWERFDNYYALQDQNPEGNCRVDIHIQGSNH